MSTAAPLESCKYSAAIVLVVKMYHCLKVHNGLLLGVCHIFDSRLRWHFPEALARATLCNRLFSHEHRHSSIHRWFVHFGRYQGRRAGWHLEAAVSAATKLHWYSWHPARSCQGHEEKLGVALWEPAGVTVLPFCFSSMYLDFAYDL